MSLKFVSETPLRVDAAKDSLSYYRKNQEANIVGQVGNMRTAVLSKRWRF